MLLVGWVIWKPLRSESLKSYVKFAKFGTTLSLVGFILFATQWLDLGRVLIKLSMRVPMGPSEVRVGHLGGRRNGSTPSMPWVSYGPSVGQLLEAWARGLVH